MKRFNSINLNTRQTYIFCTGGQELVTARQWRCANSGLALTACDVFHKWIHSWSCARFVPPASWACNCWRGQRQWRLCVTVFVSLFCWVRRSDLAMSYSRTLFSRPAWRRADLADWRRCWLLCRFLKTSTLVLGLEYNFLTLAVSVEAWHTTNQPSQYLPRLGIQPVSQALALSVRA